MNERVSTGFNLAFWVLCAVYCAWILSFPVFPTQDGPVHLYYVSVLAHLWHEPSSLFHQFFFVRHPVPPYAAYYLLLLFLGRFVGLIAAEKLVLCIAVVLFAAGFRYLVRSVSPRSSMFALAGLPLALNWTLGMGFHNYALSLGLSLFAIAFWIRSASGKAWFYRVGFLISVVLMLFSHPVPLLIAIGIAGAELLFRVAALTGLYSPSTRTTLADWVTFLIACGLSSYVLLFVSGAKTKENLQHHFIQKGMLRDALLGRPLMLISRTPTAYVYCAALFVLLAGCFWFGLGSLRRRWISREFQVPDLFLLTALFLLLAYPFIPRNMNGSDYFADRLLLYVWLFAICGVSHVPITGVAQRRIGMAMCALSATALLISEPELRPIARMLAQIERPAICPDGSRGMFVDTPKEPAELRTSFDPFLWSAASYFRQTNTIWMNAPWLDLPILPLGAAGNLFANRFPGHTIDYPDFLVTRLIASQQWRKRISPDLDFIVFVGYAGNTDRLITLPWPHGWSCRAAGWYSVCNSRP